MKRGPGAVGKGKGPGPTLPPAWAGIVEDYIGSLRAVGRSHATITLRHTQAGQFAREIGRLPADVTFDDITVWFGRHRDWKIETRRSTQAFVGKFFEWAHRSGRIPTNPAAGIEKIRPQQGLARPAPEQALRDALAVADPRLKLILRLAAEAGLRRAEIAQVQTRDVMQGMHGPQLLIHGKGGKERQVPISESLAAAVRAGAAGHTPGASSTGWLFPDGVGGHLSPPYVGTLASQALPEKVTLHMLRHFFASRAYRGTRNIRAVQQLLGHASVAVTERYTAVDDDEIRAAMMAAAL